MPSLQLKTYRLRWFEFLSQNDVAADQQLMTCSK